MELTWIEDFIALEATRNFTRAAEMRHTTQPAYSRRIQRMEEWFGVSLFMRETRPVKLTPSGVELAKRIGHLRGDIIDLKRIVANASTSIPDALRIYTTNTIAVGLLPKWIKEQGIEDYSLIVSSVSNCKNALEQGKADIALIPVLLEEGLEGAEVLEDALVFCYMPEVDIRIKKKRVETKALMVYMPGTAYGRFINDQLQVKGVEVPLKPRCESASAEALLAQVRAGQGAAWIPKSLLEEYAGTLRVQKDLSFPYQIAVLRRQG